MRITAFWARGYRSLVDVHLADLGPFNVFYGPNGAGKSNILSAMRTLFELLAWRSGRQFDLDVPGTPFHFPPDGLILSVEDQCHFQRESLVLGARVARTALDGHGKEPWPQGEELELELTYDWFKNTLTITALQFVASKALDPGATPRPNVIQPASKPQSQQLQALVARTSRRAYALIEADRTPHPEGLSSEEDPVLQAAGKLHQVPAVLAAGRLKEGLFRASNHFNAVVRQRFKQLQQVLAGPPLHRSPFEFVYYPDSGVVVLVEQRSSRAQRPSEVSLDVAGLGIAQIYSILGQALLRDADAVAIEEPEAHLHAPTSGLHLRQLLHRLVTEGYLDQLFIATHSNLFDLDPTGYLDVSLDERGATRVERATLSEIDRRHLYEPGPAKRALAEFLRFMEEDAIVFRRPDGSPVSVSEMLDMLQRDDDVALQFLRDVHGAAVRAVRVKSKKPAEPARES